MNRRWPFIAIVLAYFAVQLGALGQFGLTDDDDFYIPAGTSYVDWLGDALRFKEGAWSRTSIDAAFSPNHEHPPFAKYVFGLTTRALPFLGPIRSARFGAVLFSTLIVICLLSLSASYLGRRRGLWVGGLATLFLLLLPRFYFHSHAATLDVPVAAMYLAAATVALRSERSKIAAMWAGLVFGLALATKLNAPFLLVGHLLFALVVRRGPHLDRLAEPKLDGYRLPPIPIVLFSMVFVGLLTFVAVWPWLWFDTVERLVGYVRFHLNHYPIYFLYFGEVHTRPYAPWHAPFVMAFSTVPVATTLLAGAGLFFGAPLVRARLIFTAGPDDDVRREGELILAALIHAGLSILIVAFSGGPKYGGAKLFMPYFPFLCLLAGYGSLRLVEHAGGLLGRRWLGVTAVGIALISSLSLQLKFGTYALSQYNAVVGGLKGATLIGFERQYYDVAFRDLVVWLNEGTAKHAKVHFLPNNWEYVRTYKWYKRSGALRSDIQVVKNEAQADLIVISHERRFARYSNDLQRYRGKTLLKEKIVDSVPIWSIVKR